MGTKGWGPAVQLRDHQRRFIADIRQHFSQGSTAPLGVAPTGMGKTVCIAAMANGAAQKNNTVGVVVHRQELVVQTCLALAREGVHHGLVAPHSVIRYAIATQMREIGRSYFNSDAPTQLCSIQTLGRRLETVQPFDFLMLDEAHHAVAGTWSRLLQAMPRAKLLGMTATPERLDGKGLGAHCGGVFTSLVDGPSVAELTEAGYLAPARIFAPPMQLDLAGVKTRGGDFDSKESASRLDKPTITGDAIQHYRRLCDGVPAIAFCASVAHARHVAGEFAANGYRAKCIDGGMDDAERRNAIRALGNGRIDVLTSCEIISEGTDVPVVGAGILLRPTKSLALHLQQIGRTLRPYPGKEYAVILDHVGNSTRLGLPEEERKWSLDGRPPRKGKAGEDAAPVRQCMECYAVYPAGASICPSCGTFAEKRHREIEQQDGELVEIDKAALQRQRAQEQADAQSLEALEALGRRRGYKAPDRWAKYIWNARRQKQQRRAAG